jgi:hypothetical protein
MIPGLRCAKDDYNPFSDRSLARAIVVQASFAAGDELEVFARETLDVAVAVAGLVDSVSLSAPSNRFWDGDTVLAVGPEPRVPVLWRFFLSFCDTGAQDIEIVTYRSGGEKEFIRIPVHCTSPLSQSRVSGTYDDTVRLSATGVRDADVVYRWDFGRGNVVESVEPLVAAVVRDAGFDSVGHLWVSDQAGAHQSPRVAFLYSFNDTIGPQITCVNEGFESADTVVTGSETFFLQVRITDRGREVDTANVDGEGFDFVDGAVFTKILYRLDTLGTAPLPLTVWSRDRMARPNESRRTLYVRFDSSLPGLSRGVNISVFLPPRDSTVSALRRQHVMAMVDNFTTDQAVFTVTVNGAQIGGSDTVPPQHGSQLGRAVDLENDANSIVMSARGPDGEVLDEKAMTMIFDSTVVDSTPPVILKVTIDGEPALSAYVGADTALLRIVAFDEGSGVAQLLVNSAAVPPGDTPGVWHAGVGVSHTVSGTGVRIRAIDGEGLETDTMVTLFQNHAPELVAVLSPPYPLLVKSVYTDRLTGYDADGDPVVFEKSSGPQSLAVGSDGTVTWVPQMADTGTHTVSIRYRDGIVSQTYACTLFVMDSARYANSPAFAVGEEDFPAFMETGDTCAVTLAIRPRTGEQPLSFSAARRVGTAYEPVDITGDVFRWAPSGADTGRQHFLIRVVDRYSRSDTLYPSVLVVPPNRDFTLSLRHALDTLAGGILDMRNSSGPETLVVVIDDPDTVAVEQYRVNVAGQGREDIRTIAGSDSFLVVLRSGSSGAGTDTLTVGVVDAAGHEQTLAIVVRYAGARITVNTAQDGAGVDETLIDFPLLLRLDENNFDFAEAESDGSDLRFVKADGTALPCEIEQWDADGKTAAVWVKLDTVYAGSASQSIEMRWGDSSAPRASGPDAVFDTANGFAGVWHMNENPTGPGAPLRDRTANANHGNTNGGMGAGASVEGIAGGALEFDGQDDFVEIDSPAVSLNISRDITISGWVYVVSTSGGFHCLAGRQYGSATINSWYLGLEYRQTYVSIDEARHVPVNGSQIETGQWYFLSCVKDGARVTLYVNGAADSGRDVSTTIVSDGNDVTIGADHNGPTFGSVSDFFNGTIDEVRVSRTARSAAWIKMCYESQQPGSTVVTVQR